MNWNWIQHDNGRLREALAGVTVALVLVALMVVFLWLCVKLALAVGVM